MNATFEIELKHDTFNSTPTAKLIMQPGADGDVYIRLSDEDRVVRVSGSDLGLAARMCRETSQ